VRSKVNDQPKPGNKAIKITLTKSFTKKHKEDYEKTIVTVESELPSGTTVLEGLRTLESSIDEFLSRPEVSSSDAANLDAIQWRPFKSGNKGEWTYSDAPVAQQLVARLKAVKDKKLTIAGWHYRLSGDGDRFLQRFPRSE
jgi:hypothetical protein